MKLVSNLFITLALAVIFSMWSCTNDPDAFVARDTDYLSFVYKASSQELSVRTNGEWSITTEDSWVKMSPESGRGNGHDHQKVVISVERNIGIGRTGTVILHAAGKDMTISLSQDDGIFAIKEPSVGGTILEGKELAGAYITIPFEKAVGTEVVDIELFMSGDGAQGISYEPIKGRKLAEGDGSIDIPLSGTPRSMGDVIVEANITVEGEAEPVVVVAKGFVSSENIIYELTFDKMVWGGDYVANLPGIWPGSQDKTFGPDTPATAVATPGTDGTADLFTMSEAFRMDRQMTGWTGAKAYEHPGYPKLGTGAAGGWVLSPKLDFATLGVSEPSSIFVQFNYCRYDGENDEIEVTAVGGGSMAALKLPTDQPKRVWQLVTFKVSDATSQTQIKVDTKSGSNRMFFDNFRVYVSKAVAPEVTSKLETPTRVACDEQSPSSLTFSWAKNYDASSYLVELQSADGSAVGSATVAQTSYTFTDLRVSTVYKCRVQALYTPKLEFNSDFSAFVNGTTTAATPLPKPVVSLFEASRAMLVFDWPVVEGQQRQFDLELAETVSGPAVRTINVKGGAFIEKYPFNRFVFANLKPNTTYFARVRVKAAAGSANVDSEFGVCEAKTAAEPTLGADVLLYKDFDDFWWGGNSINVAYGVLPTAAQQKLASTLDFSGSAVDGDATIGVCTTVKNADDGFATLKTIDGVTSEYFLRRWGEQWDGSKIYEVSGHVKFGTGTAAGSLTTPTLTTLAGATSNVTYTFKAAAYTEPSSTGAIYGGVEDDPQFTVEVIGGGTINGATTATLTNNTVLMGDNLRYPWTNHTVNVVGATKDTRLKISTTGKRMWLDEIKAVKN